MKKKFSLLSIKNRFFSKALSESFSDFFSAVFFVPEKSSISHPFNPNKGIEADCNAIRQHIPQLLVGGLILIFIIFSSTFFISCKKEKNMLDKDETFSLEEKISVEERISVEESISVEEREVDKIRELAKEYVSNLSLEERISQLFMENLEGNSTFRTFETLGKINGSNDSTPLIAGGYIFFSYNIAETSDLMKDFINSIRLYCRKNSLIQPYLAVDVEGGDVNRLRKITSPLPSNLKVSKNYSLGQAFELYRNEAREMKELGFNMNLAPVAEILTEDNSSFIQERSFGDSYTVLNYASVCIKAYENESIATVLKHFPGNSNIDPHTSLPEINLSYEELEKSLVAFKRLIRKNPTAVLMSHARACAIDSSNPACLSKKWVTDILRKELGYEGLIISDDIFMAALEQNGYPPELAVVMALEAGVDCIMTSEKRFASHAAVLYEKCLIDEDFEKLVYNAACRVIFYKMKAGILENTL